MPQGNYRGFKPDRFTKVARLARVLDSLHNTPSALETSRSALISWTKTLADLC